MHTSAYKDCDGLRGGYSEPTETTDERDGQTVLVGQRGARLLAAELALLTMKYRWEGGSYWKPPIGAAPAFSAPDIGRCREAHA